MGKLVLIPTPIGNLEDITLRAIRMLGECDLIFAEDTRVSQRLLSHFDIKVPLKAFHKDNEHKMVGRYADIIESNVLTGMISDAGTPGISDPGFLLVRECLSRSIEIECLPGPVALIPALVNSGFPTDRFIYEGFLPHKKGRQTRMLAWKDEERTIVFYESPHRVVKTLEQLNEFLGADRKISVSREISKKFEQTVRGTLAEILAYFKENEPRGEFVMVLAGNEE